MCGRSSTGLVRRVCKDGDWIKSTVNPKQPILIFKATTGTSCSFVVPTKPHPWVQPCSPKKVLIRPPMLQPADLKSCSPLDPSNFTSKCSAAVRVNSIYSFQHSFWSELQLQEHFGVEKVKVHSIQVEETGMRKSKRLFRETVAKMNRGL